jgi:hypothetical protein
VPPNRCTYTKIGDTVYVNLRGMGQNFNSGGTFRPLSFTVTGLPATTNPYDFAAFAEVGMFVGQAPVGAGMYVCRYLISRSNNVYSLTFLCANHYDTSNAFVKTIAQHETPAITALYQIGVHFNIDFSYSVV